MAEQTTAPKAQKEQLPAQRTSSLVSWDDLDRWFEDVLPRRWMSSFFDRSFPHWPEMKPPFAGGWPKADLIDRDKEIVIRAELPGVAKDDLDVQLSGNTVTIRATTKKEAKEEKGHYLRQEISRGEFQRSFALPSGVKTEDVKATFKDGILELSIPKSETAQARTIKVQ